MECTVCSNKFNKTNFAKRMLKCGHSICHSCLCLMPKNLKFDYTCNICVETYRTMTDCPPNFAILDMITPESDPSTEKCPSHDRELTKFCKLCKVPTCDLCSANEHSAKFGCQECSLNEHLKSGFDVDAIRQLTHLANAYKKKKQKIEESIEVDTLCEVAFDQSNVGSCIRRNRSFLEHHLKDAESVLAKIDSLVNKKEFTTIAEYSNYEKQLQLFNKFDANVDSVCNIGCHASCNVLLENWKSISRVITDILTRNKEAYYSFEGDCYRRIMKKDSTFCVILDETETVFSSSELPVNSLLFQGESCLCYTFLIKFADEEGGEIKLNVDLRNVGSEILQDFFKTLKNGRSRNSKFAMLENALFLGFGSYGPCILTNSGSKKSANPVNMLHIKLNGLGISASELRVEVSKGYRSAEIKEEKCTEIDESKLAILAYTNPKDISHHGFYFMKCGIGCFIGDDLTLIGYHDMEIKDVDDGRCKWSTKLVIF